MLDDAARLELVVSAYRERDGHGQIRPSPAFYDLDPEARADSFRQTLTQRALEAAIDPKGLSSTARTVLARIQNPTSR